MILICFSVGWCTEGESGFDELSGSTPTSIRQQALRGLAKIAIMRHDTPQAKHTYERILGKALMGRGRPAEHWAYAEYAWLQFEDKDYEVQLSPCLSNVWLQWISAPQPPPLMAH